MRPCKALTHAITGLVALLAAPQARAGDFVVGTGGNVGGLVVFVAQQKGFFAKNGIDVKVEVRNTGPELSKGLRAGEFDFAPAAFTNLPTALERGLKVRGVVGYVGSMYTTSTDDKMLAIISGPNANINSLADLKGKRVGISFGASPDTYFQAVMRHANIPLSDVVRLNTSPPSLTSVLDTGGADAVVTWDPYTQRTLQKVAGSKLIQRGGNHVCFCAALHGSPERIYKDEAKTQKFVDAIAEAAAYVRNKAHLQEVAEIGSRFANMSKDEIVHGAANWNYDPRIGDNTNKAFNDAVAQLIEQKKMKAPYDPAQYFDRKFINTTIKQHPEWFADLKG